MLRFYSFASHKIIPCKPALALDSSQGWPWAWCFLAAIPCRVLQPFPRNSPSPAARAYLATEP